MKHLALLLISLLGLVQSGKAQNRLDFKSLRYDEEYGKIINDSNRTFLDKIKYISLSGDHSVMMSLGGEVRSQYQYFKNENWGDLPNDTDGFLLNRVLLHLDTKYKKRVRLFAQLQSSTSISRIDPNPIEKNELDVHQLFIDFNFQVRENEITFRLGRQEFLYGSQRLVSTREGPNSRQSFDAAKLIWKSKNLKTDIFYSQFVKNAFGVFNDRSNHDTKFYGVYNVFNGIPLLQNIDLYYFGLNKKMAVYNNISGDENRHSIGTRLWGSNNNWSYDFEGVYQLGKIGSQSIKAWTASFHVDYQLQTLKFKPKLGLKTDFISGDQSSEDNKLQTFNPLFPRGAYFGLAAPIGPSNLFDIHPSIELEINDKINFEVDYNFFWRLSKNDGIYLPNMTLLYPSANVSQRYSGSHLGAAIDYDSKKGFLLKLEYVWFNTGSYLKEVSTGEDIFFAGTTLYYRF